MEKYAIALILEKNEHLEKLNDYLKKFGIDYTDNYFHITLAGFESDNEDYLIEKVKEFASTHKPFKITLAHLGTFLNDDNIIFLAPQYSKRLYNYYKNLKHIVCANKDIILSPFYKSKIWAPHCSLAYKIDREKYYNIFNNMTNLVELPFEVTATKIDIYEYSNKKEKIFECNLKIKPCKKLD